MDIYHEITQDVIDTSMTKLNSIFDDCYKNVIKKTENKKSNILPFRKKFNMTCF